MMGIRPVLWLIVAMMGVTLVVPPRGYAATPSKIEGLLDLNGMIDQAVNNVAARYQLDHHQYEITRQMMHEGVKTFLSQHQEEMFPLVRDLAKARFSGQELTVEQRRRIGQAAGPLLEAAKKVILEENSKWRQILSEKQEQLHDWDLREMDGQIRQIGDNFEQMAQGQAVNNPLVPSQTPQPPEELLPSRRSPGSAPPNGTPTPITVPPTREVDQGDLFDQAVAKFIKDYQLDTSQQEAARSIGREYKQRAQAYRSAHQHQISQLEQQSNEALKKRDPQTARQAQAALEKHSAQLRSFFEQMKERLQSIPTKAQKLAYERRQQSDQEGKDKSDASKKPDQPKAPTAAGPEQSKKTDDQDSKTSPKPPASPNQPGGPGGPMQ